MQKNQELAPVVDFHVVNQLLHGSTIVLVGGMQRQKHIDRITQRFGLAKLIWVSTRESDASPRRFASVVARPDIDLVVSLLGLSRHQHGSDLRRLCRKFDVPLLTGWKSPHPNGLAAAITTQHLIGPIRVRRAR